MSFPAPVAWLAWAWALCGAPLNASAAQPHATRAPLHASDAVDDAWRALDGASDAEFAARREAVVALGPAAALRGLQTLSSADLAGRRARASIARESGSAECIEPALALLADPDQDVRLELVRFLGERRLERASTAARIDALGRAALEDPSLEVRAAAIESIAAVDDPAALARIDALLDELDAAERWRAAERLAGHAGARERLVRRVADAFGEDAGGAQAPRPLDRRTLAILLEGYGEALALLPGGGTGVDERRPLLLGAAHPSGTVRVAARSALENLLGRLVQEGELERARAVLEGLLADGFDPLEANYRRAALALSAAPSAEGARSAARAILALTRDRHDVDGRQWRVRGALLAAAAEAALGDTAAAREQLAIAASILDGLGAERPELVPSAVRPGLGNVDEAVVTRLLRCTVDLWTAVLALIDGRESADPEVLAILRAMHVRELQTQLVAVRGSSRVPADGLEVLLDDPLGPHRLLCSNPESAAWPPARAHALLLRLGDALAGVAAFEMPGFQPASSDPALHDPLADPERRKLLEEILAAAIEAVEREFLEESDRLEPDDAKRRRLAGYRNYLGSEDRKLREGSLAPLLRQRNASNFALELSYALRADGSAEEARHLSERMKLDLFGAAAEGTGPVSEMLVARLEVSVGSSWMDENRPEEAEKAFQQAENRLAAYEKDLIERASGGEGDPELKATLAAWVLEARSLRADVLLSLAVNANVRQHDSKRALDYFERAFELKQNDFMRVLLACYRARDGRAGEARQVLSEVAPSPTLYYNLACTHALLGDEELALDYLARELAENHASDRSRERQKEWARGDPDLASLRGNPRFERLVAAQ